MSHYECNNCGMRMDFCTCKESITWEAKKKPKPEFVPRKEREAVRLLKGLGYVVYKRV